MTDRIWNLALAFVLGGLAAIFLVWKGFEEEMSEKALEKRDRAMGIVAAGTAYNSYLTDNEGRKLNPETGKVEGDTKSDPLCVGVDDSVDFREIVKLYEPVRSNVDAKIAAAAVGAQIQREQGQAEQPKQ